VVKALSSNLKVLLWLFLLFIFVIIVAPFVLQLLVFGIATISHEGLFLLAGSVNGGGEIVIFVHFGIVLWHVNRKISRFARPSAAVGPV